MSDFELCHLLELCAPEYNMPELSDRVLVFDVMGEGWEMTSLLENGNKERQPLSLRPGSFNEPLRQHKIYVHSFWLSVQCPYFRSLFHSSGIKESQEKEVHVKISKSEETGHLLLVEAMYRSDVLDDKTVDELLAVLELANKYDLKLVFKKCKSILQTNPTTFEKSTKIMHLINENHNMNDVEDLLGIVQRGLVKEFCPLDKHWHSDKFASLSELCLNMY